MQAAPQTFRVALNQLRQAKTRDEVELNEVPAPVKLAPYAVAMSADVAATNGEALAVGRFIMLYDPEYSEVWDGNFRIVTYIKTRLESDLGEDPLVSEVAWTWMVEALEDAYATYRQPGGTASRVLSQGFGMLDQQIETIDLELRASWTPEGDYLDRHLTAWSDMVCTFAGLPPVTEGVVPLSRHRRK
ncbi:MAG TPA: DUF3000 domain-containing protein [Enteractinococcus helveticum]|uniref:DUF3000 domain-containing protein n=1 Tax=Enteractinococcus helveticum TaxID=1837282 RepID=A0A921K8U7_9MICC|nr:DUF3000 domain-containing protein [Enteractinococcus helveticum]HJF15651.1 DUF3000 domain-containing protein [Enteractinococcus helveticum]